MKNTRNGFALSVAALCISALFLQILWQNTEKAKAISERETETENYDIRLDQGKDARKAKEGFAGNAGRTRDLGQIAEKSFINAEAELKTGVPGLKIEYSDRIRHPEVIATAAPGPGSFLTGASPAKRAERLREFLSENSALFGLSQEQIGKLKVTADYENPDGNLSYAHLEQQIDGIPVFQGEVKAGFTKRGEIIRVINNLAPHIDESSLAVEGMAAEDALPFAYQAIGDEMPSGLARNEAGSTELKVKFGEGDWATTAEKMYFPVDIGVARLAWRVLIWKPVDAYYVVIDAESGGLLWRKNISSHQALTATFGVYGNELSSLKTMDSPTPFTPACINPLNCTQPPLSSRSIFTLIGNEGSTSFNNLGWIPDTGLPVRTPADPNVTDGNAVESGIDRDGLNGVDAPVSGNPFRVFNFNYTPAPGAGAESPLIPEYQKGSVTNNFYMLNRWHDEMYKAGFTEQARNFQHFNFGRGGVENDRVSSEVQDSSGTNGANFATPADGTRPRSQMFIWTGDNPDRDAGLDATVALHEMTHGLSNRLIGNGAGLSGGMGGMMGEGWSDWYALALLSEPTDPINGIYANGGYALYLISPTYTASHYYGVRRFPTAVISFLGPNGRPHNPLTFRHINAGCDSILGTATAATISAYPRNPAISTSGLCSGTHNGGEVWSSALWEVWAKMRIRLGSVDGNRKAIQLVTDGMKLSPLNPNFLQGRDAIIAAAAASSISPEAAADVADVREGFRLRGMGFSASVITNTQVVEAFDLPNAQVAPTGFSVSDLPGNNNGFPEPNENVMLTVPVVNQNTGQTMTNVTASVQGGGSANYGSIPDGQTVTRQIPFRIPCSATCGGLFSVTITVSSDVGAQIPELRSFRVGVPVGGAPVVASNNNEIVLPDGTGGSPAPALIYPSNVTVSGVSFTAAKLKVKISGYSHSFPGDNDFLLVGPGGERFEMVSDQGGGTDVAGVDLILDDGAATALPTILTAGNYRPTADASADIFPPPAPATYELPAPGGTATFASVFGTNGTAYNGTWGLYVVDDAVGDTGTIAGWSITIESDVYACTISCLPSVRSDFDGDGKTDVSVFRPSQGTWYLNRSTAGFTAFNFGLAGDQAIPGDYDGDGKADAAIFRPTNTAGAPDFYVLKSSNSTVGGASWGNTGDVAASGDYDGDGKADYSVFRQSDSTWYTLAQTGNPAVTAVAPGIAAPADYDGDGKTDMATFNGGAWTVRFSSGGSGVLNFGLPTDYLAPADYDGDGKDDIAVFRPNEGVWYVAKSSGGISITQFGNSEDVPVPGDYDGDGKDDIAVYRKGIWYINRSNSGLMIESFGLTGDVATPRGYLP